MNLKSIAAAVVLVTGSAAALAAGPGDVGTIGTAPLFVNNSVTGVFSDIYKFTLTGNGVVTGSATSLNFSFNNISLFNIDGFSVKLLDSSAAVIGTDSNPSDGFSFSGLSAGTYLLNFVGLANGSNGGAYAGVLSSVTTPVPEPETYAMMLAGLAAIGFVATRRRQS